MTFNIHQKVFTKDGELKEEAASQYREQLAQLFEASPEAQALRDEGIEPGWASMMVDFGLDYLGVTPPQISPASLEEILFDLFPRKVSASPDDAPEIIRELRAFWQFMQREFHLENAAACLEVLNDDAIDQLEEEMGNPENFGMAKSLMMMGMERGFDMTSEEGLQKWVETYNAELSAGTGLRVPLPGERSRSARQVRKKIKQKIVKDTRKKNRKKK